MSDELSDALWVEPKAKPSRPETRVEDALRKALDRTTPERPGVPWEEEEKHVERGWTLPGSDS